MWYDIFAEKFVFFLGCKDLLAKVQNIQPDFHIFGHIHENPGVTVQKNLKTSFINATSVDHAYQPVHKPIMFRIMPTKNKTIINEEN